MTRTCFLHIGLPKTGSTTIQASFAGFSQPGLRYAQLGNPNHSFQMTVSVWEDYNRILPYRPPKVDTIAALKQQKEKFSRLLNDEYQKPGSLILSGELLPEGMTQDEMKRLHHTLKSNFDDVKVIAYFRDYHSLAPSLFQERVKFGQRAFAVPKMNYGRWVRPWIDLFGRDAFDFVKFERKGLVNGDVLADFAGRVGADLSLLRRSDKNESMPLDAMALMYQYNKNHPNAATITQTKLERAIMRSRLEGFGNGRFAFSPADIAAAVEMERDEIEWMQKMTGFDLIGQPGTSGTPVENEDHLLSIAADAADAFREHCDQHRDRIASQIAGHRRRLAEKPRPAGLLWRVASAVRSRFRTTFSQ